MAALECVARDVSGDPNLTFGAILKRYPGLVPRPLDTAIEKVWGYSSTNARHVQEGKEPKESEARLVVWLAGSVIGYLVDKTHLRTHGPSTAEPTEQVGFLLVGHFGLGLGAWWTELGLTAFAVKAWD